MAQTKQLLRALVRNIEEDDTEAIVDIAGRILHVTPSDTDALLCKVHAHVSDGDYDLALAAASIPFSSSNSKTPLHSQHLGTFRTYRAYCLYRLGRLTDAVELFPSLSSDDISVKHLKIQTFYRLGRYSDAVAVLDTFLPVSAAASARDDEELLSNALAVRLAAGQTTEAGSIVADTKLDRALTADSNGSSDFPASHELAFNAACVWMALGDYDKARAALAKSKDLFHASAAAAAADDDGADNASSGDMGELTDILAQEAYIMQKLSDHTGATLAYHELMSATDSSAPGVAAASAATAAALTNNSLASASAAASAAAAASTGAAGTGGASGIPRPADAAHRLETVLAAAGDKILPSQRAALARNIAVLFTRAGLAAEARDRVREIKGGNTGEFGLFLNLAILIKEKNYAKAVQVTKEYIAANPSCLPARLALVHVHLVQDKLDLALSDFESLLRTPAADKDMRMAPASIAIRLALIARTPSSLLASGAFDKALCDAVDHWEAVLDSQSSLTDGAARAQASSLLHTLRGQAAEAHVRANRPADAVKAYTKLAEDAEKQGEHDAASKYLARVVALTAESSPEVAAAALKKLPPVPMRTGADVDALESGPAPMAVDAVAAAAAAAAALAAAKAKAEAKARGRKAQAASGFSGAAEAMTDDDDDEEEEDDAAVAAAAAAAAGAASGALFLPNGKRVFTADKLATVRAHKRARRRRTYPAGVTAEAAAAVAAARAAGTAAGAGADKKSSGPDPYRWLPKWERPVIAGKGKGAGSKKAAAALMRGPQGSGVSENAVEMSLASPAKQQVTKGGGDNRPRNKRR